MRQVSPPFKLDPGFEADGKKYVSCTVRLLTRTEREVVSQAAQSQLNARLLEATKSKSPITEPIVIGMYGQTIERRLLFAARINSFCDEEGGQVTDPHKLEEYAKLITEPDEEAITEEAEGWIEKFRRPKRRAIHTCGECGASVECTRAVSSADAAQASDVPAD